MSNQICRYVPVRKFPFTILLLLCMLFAVDLNAQVPFPGTVVAESPDPLNNSYASPAIIILPDGSYLSSNDINSTTSSVYKSDDRGLTWRLISMVKDSHWSSLFLHNNEVYLLGVAKSFNNIIIHKSTDGGNTWTTATNANTGILLQGRFHTAPTPVVVHNGRIWKAFEESPDPANERDFHAFVYSAPVGADLLKATSWTKSSTVALNPTWFNADSPEWCEGNVVVGPGGNIVNIIRMSTTQPNGGTLAMNGYATGIPRYEVAAKINISSDGLTASFNPLTGFIHFPGAMTKFTIRYDAVSGKYWTIVNKITNIFSGWDNNSVNNPYNQRNVLMLTSSSDLVTWEERYKVIRWNEGDAITRRTNFGFQYVDWQFDGNDIVAVSRTSWYGSDWHDANMITFHRLPDFRTLSIADSPADIGYLTASPPAVLSWKFDSPATTGTESTINSTYTNSNLQVSVLSRGAGLNAAAGFARSFNSSSGTQHNSKVNAVTRNEYFQFEVQAKPGFSVSLATIDAKLARTSTGSKSYRWAFSKDGTNFKEIGSGEVFGLVEETEGTEQPPVHLEMYKELQNVPSSVKITFRMYVWGSTSSSGRFSIGRYGLADDTPSLAIGGKVIETSAIEETPLLGWKFQGLTGVAANNYAAEVKDAALMASSLTRGSGFTAASLNGGYYSTAPVHTRSESRTGNDFYEFTAQANSGQYMSLGKLLFKLRRNSSGPTIYRWTYSVGDVNFIELGGSDIPFIGTLDPGYVQQPIDLSGIAELQNISSTQRIRFRLYPWGGSATSGGIGFARYTDDYCLALYGITSDQVISAWAFATTATGRENSTLATTSHPNLQQSELTRGNNVAGTSGSSASFAGNFPVTTNRQQAIDADNYFQFTIKANPGYRVSLSSLDARLRVLDEAPHHYCWRYSTDGINFYDAGPADQTIGTTVNNGVAVPQITLSSYVDLQNVTADKTITFRIYAWGGIAPLSASGNSFGIGKSLSGANALIVGGTISGSGIASQQIVFNELPSKTYGDADFSPGATSDNNTVAISYSSDNTSVATIVDGKIRILGAGTANITASQAADETHSAAVNVIQQLTIAKATLTVTANSFEMCQGHELPLLTLIYDNFKNGDTEHNLNTKATVNTIVNNSSVPDTYALIPSGAVSDNYAFDYVDGKLIINGVSVAVNSSSGSNISKGESLTLTATGGTSYSWTSTNGMTPVQNSAAITIRPTKSGTYTVTAINAGGCRQTSSLNIKVNEDYQTVKANNILTPNGDGYNDVWMVDNIDMYPNNEVKIFDKSGRLLYSKKGYDNTWNGTLNGIPLAENTYYYILDFGIYKPKQKGYITLIK